MAFEWDRTLENRRIQFVELGIAFRARIAGVTQENGLIHLRLVECMRLWSRRWKKLLDRSLSFPVPHDEHEAENGVIEFTFKRCNHGKIFPYDFVFDDEKAAWLTHVEGVHISMNGVRSDRPPKKP